MYSRSHWPSNYNSLEVLSESDATQERAELAIEIQFLSNQVTLVQIYVCLQNTFKHILIFESKVSNKNILLCIQTYN